VSDPHINSAVGLLPPGAQRDDGQEIKPSKSQAWLWERWQDYWNDVKQAALVCKAQSSVVINGDWGDLNKHDGFQLLTTNPDTVIDWMTKSLQPLADFTHKLYVVRGTEAHVGGSGWLEERAAKDAGAVSDAETGLSSFWVLRLQIEGVRVLLAHHPGTNSRVPWTVGAAANRAAVKTQLAFGATECPDLAIFAHVHHSEDSFDNHAVRAIFTPPWCLADAYSYRLGFGWAAQEIGGLIIIVDDNKFRVIKRFAALPVGGRGWIKV